MTNRKLKIAVMVDQLVPGGVQKSAIREARELIKLGFQVTLVVLVRSANGYQYQDLSRGLKLIYLSDLNPYIFRRAIKIPYFAFLTNLHILNPYFTHRYALLKNYDLIISHGTTTCITARAIYRHLHIPYVAFIWDPMLFILEKVYQKTPIRYFFPIIKPLIFFYERSFLEDALLVITSSKVHQRFLQDMYRVEPVIIPPGCGSYPEQLIYPKKGRNILGYTRWELAKNPQLFLWLAKKLPRARFIIAGSWSKPREELYFKNLIKKYKLEKQITLFTPGSEQNIKKITQSCLVWLHPNFEAFGMSGLEMASYGLPLIIPQYSGLTEIFTFGKHGFFPKNNSKSEFLKYLKLMLKNPLQTQQMGIEAGKIARTLTWKKHTQTAMNMILPFLYQPKFAILEICQVIGTNLSGGDKLMEPMAQRLQKQFNFSVITSYFGINQWRNASFIKKIIVLPKNYFDLKNSPVPVFLTYCLRMWTAAIKLIKQHYAFVYSSTNILPDILPAYMSKKIKPDIHWIARVHHLIPPPYKREGNFIVNTVSFCMQILSLKLIKNTANIIIALNHPLKNELLKRGFPEEKLSVLGAGINIQKITETPIYRSQKYTGVFLGRLHATKGIYDLVPIWKKVVNEIPQAKLAIIGGGPDYVRQTLYAQIKKNHMAGSVSLLGYLPDEKVINIMRQAQVFLFTDHEAGWGLAAAEAMACGLPVVGYDIGILGNVFREGYIRVDYKQTAKFAQEIIDLLIHPQRQRGLSRRALYEAKRHTWHRVAKKFERLLETAGFLS